MDFSDNAVQEPPASMDPPNPDDIAAVMENKMKQCWKRPLTYTIFPIPDVFFGIDDRIQSSPQLASFGPHHRRKNHLLPFEVYKKHFLSLFLSRPENKEQGKDFYVEKLKRLKERTKGCYSERICMPPNDEELVDMMLHDGSFMVELFRKYEENRGVTWPWLWPIQTLIADLLNLENQLPFFILEELFECSKTQVASTPTLPTPLPTLALRFLNQAFCSPSDVINSPTQHPKHLLDLFRLSLLPSTETYPQQSEHLPLVHSIQSVKQLRSAGIAVRQKTAKSLLEIDFRKFQIPPLALKIPPIAIDDFTSTILVNCVALEQCLQNQSKHFTAYVCFMNCLMKQPEDVGFLRSVEIITRVSQDEMCFINMLNSLGRNVSISFSVGDSYLGKQFREIHSYYNSIWASIGRHFSNFFQYWSILAIVFAILSWRLPVNSSTSSVPN